MLVSYQATKYLTSNHSYLASNPVPNILENANANI